MINVEPLQNLDGFGTGKSQTEYYYSQGMCRTQFGLTPSWLCSDEINSGSLSGLGVINAFGANSNNIYGIDNNGIVYGTSLFSQAWTNMYLPYGPNTGNGLIVDQTNRVLACGTRYLSKWDGVTASYTTGTVNLTNASSSVSGIGTSWTTGMIGKQITFQQQPGTVYTISGVTSATILTLSANYTGATFNGSSHTIYMGSTEQWKDLVTSLTTVRPMDIYQDQVLIGNGNGIAALSVIDDSFQNQKLSLPTGYNVAALKSGSNGVLVGINANFRGAIFLWDGQAAGSISEWIWFNGNIKAIVPTPEGYYGWYVITSNGIYLTNGYMTVALYKQMPDDGISASGILSNITANGVVLLGKYLIFFGGSGSFNRQRQGIYIFNTEASLFEFCPVSNQVQRNVTMGAMFYDNTSNFHLSYQTAKPSITAIARLFNAPPSSAYYITEPKGLGDGRTAFAGDIKTAEAAKFTITQNLKPYGNNTYTFNLALKVYNFQRPLWAYASTNQASSAYNNLIINGTIFGSAPVAQIGDEVTVIEGVNAGQVAHITNIANQGTSTETWTLDTSLPAYTENTVNLSVSPFKLAKSFSFSGLAQLRDVYFDIASKYKGKRFLLKLLVTNITGVIALDITDGQFMYSDQGLLTS